MTHPGTWEEDRIYSADYGPLIRLHPVPQDQEQARGVEVTADVGDQEVTVRLDLEGITKLRRALQRHERRMNHDAQTTTTAATDTADELSVRAVRVCEVVDRLNSGGLCTRVAHTDRDHRNKYGTWFTSTANYTCGGVTGHATGCDRSTCLDMSMDRQRTNFQRSMSPDDPYVTPDDTTTKD
jgi:hypothetical protein